jgi:integrase
VAIPENILPDVDERLRTIGPESHAWLFPGLDGHPISTRTLNRAWNTARTAFQRTNLRFHDLRHFGTHVVGKYRSECPRDHEVWGSLQPCGSTPLPARHSGSR